VRKHLTKNTVRKNINLSLEKKGENNYTLDHVGGGGALTFVSINPGEALLVRGGLVRGPTAKAKEEYLH